MARKHNAIHSPGVFDNTAAAPARLRKPARDKRTQVDTEAFQNAPAPQSTTAVEEEPSGREVVARLAYSYWESRGYQGGSAEDDWARAEAEYRSSRA